MQNQTELFRKSLGQWVDKVGNGLDALARVACQDLSEAVVDDTPIDTGFLVGNWQPSLNAPTLAVDETGSGNGYAQSKVGIVVAGIKAGDVYYMVNNAAYARRIEYGFVGADSLGRVYNQPGRHMVTINIKRWDKLGLAA
jgi:hypothetical protein